MQMEPNKYVNPAKPKEANNETNRASVNYPEKETTGALLELRNHEKTKKMPFELCLNGI